MLAAVVFATLFSFSRGRYTIGWEEIGHFFLSLFKNGSPDLSSEEFQVFYYIRLPRVILAFVVGASLCASGTVFQGIFRNPLASPDILGVASGCSFGAALGIMLDTSLPYDVQFFSFFFGLIAMLLVYFLSGLRKNGNLVMLILAGMIVSALFCSGISLLKYLADPLDQLPAIVFWIMGGLHRASWLTLKPLLYLATPLLTVLLLLSWKLNILAQGEEEAEALGLNVKRYRLALVLINTLLIAASVSVCGSIGWIGLMIPHISRMLVGHDHLYSLPFSMVSGGVFLMLLDTLARSISSSEIPVSIITSITGALFLAFLINGRRGKSWL